MIIEPERYELREGPFYEFALERRDFLKAVGGGIAIACVLSDTEVEAQGRRRGRGRMPREIGAWIHIGKDGAVTAYTGKAEVGQDIRTSLTLVVAEELRVPVAFVRMVMGDTKLTPYDMGTFGSRTTPAMAPQLRRAAAAARETLIDLANGKWRIDRAKITVEGGRIVHADGKRAFAFGELTKGEKLVKAIEGGVPTTAPADWKVCGKPSVHKVDGREIVTGARTFSSDLKRPGMLFGKVLRPPAFRAKLVSADLTKADAMPGVTAVRDGDFVGVAAPDEATAQRAVLAIDATWETESQPSHKGLYEHLRKNTVPGGRGGGWRGRASRRNAGSVKDGLAAADEKLERTYTVAYIQHVPLEPRAAVAEWRDGRLDVWTGTQRPFGVHGQLVSAFGLPPGSVRVRVPATGAGYGGKHTGEAAVEAARLAKAAGKPVKVVWTREEEFTWAYFRPAGVIDVESGVKKDGTLTAWRFENYNSGASAIAPEGYRVENREIAFHYVDSPLREGSYRALATTANVFARETHIDELAHAVKMDPLALRMKNLENARLRAVFEAAAERFGWKKRKRAPGRGFGIAGGYDKGGYIATCAEVTADERRGAVKVERIVAAFECGALINPSAVETQVEGCVIMGLGGALFEEIRFENGRILNPRFSSYRVPRFSDIPPIEVVLLDRKDLPSAGAGETPIAGIAPALGNAIFDATGKRLRSLPLLHGM